jgi:hypothetical protein
MRELQSEFLYEVYADLDKPIDLGITPRGNRQIYYIKGGSFKGPNIKGDVLPGGGDWFLIRSDGTAEMDVKATVRTDDGDLIYVCYTGYLYASPDVWQKMMKEEPIDPSEYYFRCTPYYETSSQKYSWLNRIVAVGIGRLTETGVAFKVYKIL